MPNMCIVYAFESWRQVEILVDAPPPLRDRSAMDDFEDTSRVVGDLEEVHIGEVDGLGLCLEHILLYEIPEWIPKCRLVENDGHTRNLQCLDEGEHTEELIEGAVTTREENIGLCRKREHSLPAKEVGEVHSVSVVWIRFTLTQQMDAEADRVAAGLLCATGCSFHDTWSTTGNDCVLEFLGDLVCEFGSVFVVDAVRRSHR